MSTCVTIGVTEKFIKLREERACLFNKTDIPDGPMRMRADCELYEWHMAQMNQWDPSTTWSFDGTSDKYGKVDVKVIDRWWNIPIKSMWNICRQHDVVDHWYFIRKVKWPDRPLVAGDEVIVEFVGVMTFDEIMKRIEVSKIPGYGFYVDPFKYATGEDV